MNVLRTVGVTNNAGTGFLYFQEFDNINLFDVLEEANFISQIAGIDIHVLQSSKESVYKDCDSYHLVSFDILSKREMQCIEHLNSKTGHYPDYDELGLSRVRTAYKRLRIGQKLDKSSPVYLRTVKTRQRNNHVVSLAHALVYRIFCGVLYPKTFRRFKLTVHPKRIVCTYLFGSARKDLKAKKFREDMVRLERKLDRKVYIPRCT